MGWKVKYKIYFFIYKLGIFVNFEKKMLVKMMNFSLDIVQYRNIRINVIVKVDEGLCYQILEFLNFLL